jgi:hypothetical protein
MTARCEMGTFAQRLGPRSYLVMVEVLGTFRDNLMVPGRATDIVLVHRPVRTPASRAEPDRADDCARRNDSSVFFSSWFGR